MTKLSVIMPAYNEENGIKDTLMDLLSFCESSLSEYEVIVVDDASTDNTGAEASKFPKVEVLTNPVNIGYGASIKRGLLKARYEHILIMDADGTYPASEVKKLLPFAWDFDMVIGVRKGKYYRGSPLKNLSRKLFYLLVWYVTGEKIPDVNSGLRIFKKGAAVKFFDRLCSGFSFTTTITIALISTGHLIKHVDIDYKKRVGRSKVRFFRDSLRTLQILVEAISYFNPIKAFLPFVVFSLGLSLIALWRYFIVSRDAYLICASIFLFSGLLFFSFGMLGYIITKKKDE